MTKYKRHARSYRTKRVLPNLNPAMDWREEVERMLIESGITGIRQIEFTITFARQAEADEITAHLQSLEAEKKVQKFVIQQKRGRPATVWRATTLIMED